MDGPPPPTHDTPPRDPPPPAHDPVFGFPIDQNSYILGQMDERAAQLDGRAATARAAAARYRPERSTPSLVATTAGVPPVINNAHANGDVEGSGHDHDEDDDNEQDEDDDDEDHESDFRWYAIGEDKSAPCEDELVYIGSKDEHSALDYTYWETQAYFDLDDPEITRGESGRIDWLVEGFNGTKEQPNKEILMKSPIAKIGGYDWQVKLYPQGNRSDFLSVYVDCVTMLADSFEDKCELTDPALPVLSDSSRTLKRNSMAAQVAVIMYNPDEPRVYEFKTDAHQFHKKSTDFGWKYFSCEPRYDFHIRRHGQRQAILRGDKLAFSAYIRIVYDPTGCMFDRTFPCADTSLAATGLRPFDMLSAQLATLVPLLHLRPFRDLLYKHKSGSLLTCLQIYLDKMLNRRLKRKHLKHSPLPDGRDIVEILQKIRARLAKESPTVMPAFDDLFGSLSPHKLPICFSRLRTEGCSSIQEAFKHPATSPREYPQVLIMELKRHTFNAEKRKWEKVTNDVSLDDEITDHQSRYKLYAFVTHSGPLGSPNFTPYIRPGGIGGKWYAYEVNQVRCLTQKQAKPELRSGASLRKAPPPIEESREFVGQFIPPSEEVAYLVMYVRVDIADYAFELPAVEKWDIPETVRKPDRAASNGGERLKSSTTTAESEKTAFMSLSGPLDMSSALNRLAQTSTLPPIHLSSDLMDGDDVVMSDAEGDGSRTPIRFDRVAGGAGTIVHANQDPVRSAQASPQPREQTREETIDFFGSEHYRGSVLASSDEFHGQGALIATNGDQYTGNFSHGLPDGTGTMIYNSGDTYVGSWVSGKHEGQGTFIEAASGNVYEGGWKEGRRHGKFVLRGEVTEEDKARCQICYENDVNTAFYECGHVLACKDCAARIENCPVCRKRVLARVELFRV